MRKLSKTLKKRPGLIVKVIIAAIVLVVIALATTLYFKNRPAGTGPAIPGKVALSADCKDKDTDLCKFVNKWEATTSYTITSTGPSSTGTTTSVYEVMDADTYRLTATSAGKEQYALVYIGNTSYTKDLTDGKWWQQVAESTTKQSIKNGFGINLGGDDQPSQPAIQYKAVGKEACGQLMCFKYQVFEPNGSGRQFIWFDDRDYILRRMQASGGEIGTTNMIFSYDSVTIAAPSPTKPVPAGKVVVPGK